ncbi:MAG TPA: hypothetical protein VGX27_01495 [Candidatus Dormibacteraeota bacterium]|nr:hypothetical protein [Candidatus Dormibacteraeota bacterium]
MSQDDEDLELRALERQLDDAFETTRPRPAFEDELWLKVQESRPAPRRLRDALGGFWNALREVPAVPAAATALVLVVAIGVGIIAVNGRGGAGGGSTAETRLSAPAAGQYLAGTFGRVPSPRFASGVKTATPGPGAAGPSAADLSAPVQYTWAGTFDLKTTTAPVFRYHEPSATDADQFASALGAVLRSRPSGFLGMYSASDYTLKVRGTVASPASSPAYFIFSGLNLPAIDAAGGPQAIADVFLAQHSLQPQWEYTVSVDVASDPQKVLYERQFDVPGSGPAYLVDYNAGHYGLEVDISDNRPVIATGLLPVSMDVANYNLISSSDAIRAVTGSASPPPSPAAAVVQLTQAELVYVLVPAGDHSFYEPAYLFTGTQQVGGQSYTRHVLISAIQASQRT